VTRKQRIAAYSVCVDADARLLVCRLSGITERPGWWTLPGGGVEFGEHPEQAALRELREETGYTGRIAELLTVDSITRDDYHSVRVVYRTEITGGALTHEQEESTDMAAWCSRADLAGMLLVGMGELGVRLAYGERS
jgi:8-oxo-dGTP diphosphatase